MNLKKHINNFTGTSFRGKFFRTVRLLDFLIAGISLVLLYSDLNAQSLNISNTIVNIPAGAYVITNGSITLQNTGSLDNSGSIQIKGNWINNGNGLINASPGTVILDGSVSQDVGGTSATIFHNLTLNNTGGATISNNETVSGTLVLNGGNISTATFAMQIPSIGQISRTSGHINGNLQMGFNTPATKKFEIGDVTTYAPIDLTMNSLGTPGDITAFTTPGPEPNENNPVTNASGINQSAKANRYWTMTDNGITSPAYDATFNFDAGEATGIPASYVVRQFNLPSTWSATTIGAQNATATQATGLTSFGEFEVGEKNTLTVSTQPNNVSACSSFNAVFTSSSSAAPAPAIQWEEDQGSGFLLLTNTPPYSGVNTNTLTITGTTGGMNGWQYRAVFTNINGSVNSDPASLTIAPQPVAVISNNSAICIGNPATVQVVLTGSGPWNYIITDGSQNIPHTSVTSPDNVTITPLSTGVHNYIITGLTDANCTGSSTGTATVTVSSAPPSNNVGTINGPADACNGTVSLITVNTVGGPNINYSWNTGTNSSVVLFSNSAGGPFSPGPFQTSTNSVYAQFGALAGSSGYNVCVQGTNGCGSTNNKCTWIRGIVGVPGTITPASNAIACPNDVKSYSCGSSGAAVIYNWTLGGSTAPVTSGQGFQNIQVTFPPSFTSGQLCVTASLSCGGSSTSAPRCMTISNTPVVPGAFTNGPSKVCPGATGVVFSVPPVTGATGYSWTTPAGTTITSGAGTPSITVNFPNPYTGAPPVCVSALSACGTSVARCKTVGTNLPGQPGSVNGPTTNICNSTVQYSISNVTGATTYTWTNPAGTTIAAGQGSTSILLQVSPVFTSGFLTVVANTNLCTPGSSPPRTITIYGKPNVPGNIIANPALWCTGGFVNFSVATASPLPIYNWTVSNGTITAGQGSTNIDVTWGATAAGTVTVNAGNACGTSSNRVQSFSAGCREEDNGQWSMVNGQLTVYPNPAHDVITVSIDVPVAPEGEPQTNLTLQLIDITGRIMIKENHNATDGLNIYELGLNHLPKGVYMLKVRSGGKSWKTKVIVE